MSTGRSPAESEDDLEDTYRLRLVLDPLATELAVPLMTDRQIAQTRKAFDGLVRAYREDDDMAQIQCHRRFHLSICGHCGSDRLLRFVTQLADNSVRYQRMSFPRRGSMEDRMEEHRRILEWAAVLTAISAVWNSSKPDGSAWERRMLPLLLAAIDRQK